MILFEKYPLSATHINPVYKIYSIQSLRKKKCKVYKHNFIFFKEYIQNIYRTKNSFFIQ